MAKWLVNIDLTQNELQNGVIHNLSTQPSGVAGQMYYNTSTNKMFYNDGGGPTSWVEFGSGSGTITNAYVSMTDGTTTASASGEDTFKFRSANNILTAAVGSNDVTHGDNLLLTINEANITHANISGAGGNIHVDHSTVSITPGTGLSGGGDITASRTIDLDFDNLAEKTGNLVATDRLVGVSGTTHFSETISQIPLSIFNNDSGWTNNTGTVTSVSAGNGMNFTTITGSGAVTLGTPSTITSGTGNTLTATSHTALILLDLPVLPLVTQLILCTLMQPGVLMSLILLLQVAHLHW